MAFVQIGLFHKTHGIQSWLKRISGKATVESFGELTTESAIDSYFAFSTKWQLAAWWKFSSLRLDFTHDTCYALDDPHRKAFLYTIAVKHDIAGRVVPDAFMLASSESRYSGKLSTLA